MVIDYMDTKKTRQREIFAWAVSEQQRMGCMAEPIALDFKADDLVHDPPGCVVSIFYNDESGEALLRRDWLEDMGIKYNLLTNFDEIERIAPRSVKRMLDNGAKLYAYYDGAHGGITRRTDVQWAYT